MIHRTQSIRRSASFGGLWRWGYQHWPGNESESIGMRIEILTVEIVPGGLNYLREGFISHGNGDFVLYLRQQCRFLG